MTSTPKFEAYPDSRGEWRWRFRASNGLTLADSGEGYKNIDDLLKAIRLLKAYVPKAPVEGIPTRRTVNSLLGIGAPPTLANSLLKDYRS
jgi:uncharacterized protein YegP (UPF0339 family)